MKMKLCEAIDRMLEKDKMRRREGTMAAKKADADIRRKLNAEAAIIRKKKREILRAQRKAQRCQEEMNAKGYLWTLKSERKAQRRAYREAHREERKAQRRAYREAHKDELKAQQRAYYEAHREELKAQQKAYREAHKDELKAQQKAWSEAHREEYREKHRAWQRSHPDLVKLYNVRSRCRRRQRDECEREQQELMDLPLTA